MAQILLFDYLNYYKSVKRTSIVGEYTIIAGVRFTEGDEGVTFYINGKVKDVENLQVYFSVDIYDLYDYIEEIDMKNVQTEVVVDFITISALLSNISEIISNEDNLADLYETVVQLHKMKKNGETNLKFIKKEYEILVQQLDKMLS